MNNIVIHNRNDYEQYLTNPVWVDFTNFPITPLTQLQLSSGISFNTLGLNTKTITDRSLGKIFEKHNLGFISYIQALEFNFKRLINSEHPTRESLLKEVTVRYANIDTLKTYFSAAKSKVIDVIARQFNLINNIRIEDKQILLDVDCELNSLRFAGNNTTLFNDFFRDAENNSYIRNGQTLMVTNSSIFHKTSEGVYPVLVLGFDKGTLFQYKKALFNTYVYGNGDFSNMKICMDYDWYMSPTNKTLKLRIINELESIYKNIDIILIDGKKFASENMHTYSLPSFKTLAKKKEFYKKIELSFYERNRTVGLAEDLNPTIEDFLKTYQEFLKNTKPEEEEKAKTVILEESALTQEDIAMINSLMAETQSEDVHIPEPQDVEFEEAGPTAIIPQADLDYVFNDVEQSVLHPSLGQQSIGLSGSGIYEQIRTLPITHSAPITAESLMEAIREIRRNGGFFDNGEQ